MALRDDERIGFTVKEVADYFSVSEQSIRRSIHLGQLAAVTFGRRVIVVDPGIHRLIAQFHRDKDELEQLAIDEQEEAHGREQTRLRAEKREQAIATARAEAQAAQDAASASGLAVNPAGVFLPAGRA